MSNSLRDAVLATEHELPQLGDTVIWWMDGVEVKHADLLAALDRAGLGDYAPRPPTPRVALHRALQAFLRARAGDGTSAALTLFGQDDPDADTRKPLIRSINEENSDWMVFGVVQEAVNAGLISLKYQTAFRIKVHKYARLLVCTTTAQGDIDAVTASTELTEALTPFWTHYQELMTSRDLSRVVKSIVDWAAAIRIRQAGGCYFVPASNRETLDKVRGLVADLQAQVGGQPMFLTLGVPDESRTRIEMGKAAHFSLLAEVEELVGEMNTLIARQDENRVKTIRTKLQEYVMMGLKVQEYEGLLGLQLHQAHEALDRLMERAEAMLQSS